MGCPVSSSETKLFCVCFSQKNALAAALSLFLELLTVTNWLSMPDILTPYTCLAAGRRTFSQGSYVPFAGFLYAICRAWDVANWTGMAKRYEPQTYLMVDTMHHVAYLTGLPRVLNPIL